jgi:Holliday junction resolvase
MVEKDILESKVQRQIIRYLEDAGWYVVKILQTTKNGWPDLQALRLGPHEAYGDIDIGRQPIIIFIEVKRPGTKPTPLQLIRHEELRSRGFRVIVADSLESLIEQL